MKGKKWAEGHCPGPASWRFRDVYVVFMLLLVYKQHKSHISRNVGETLLEIQRSDTTNFLENKRKE